MDKKKVLLLAEQFVPQYKIDPTLTTALVWQESSFDETAIRFEPAFLKRYVEPLQLTQTNLRYHFSTEILLSMSYGLTQMMGESLREIGFFDWYFKNRIITVTAQIATYPMQNTAVADAIDWYMMHPEAQIEWGLKWLVQKIGLAHGDIRQGLLYWNGGSNKQYDDDVIAKQTQVKGW